MLILDCIRPQDLPDFSKCLQPEFSQYKILKKKYILVSTYFSKCFVLQFDALKVFLDVRKNALTNKECKNPTVAKEKKKIKFINQSTYPNNKEQ